MRDEMDARIWVENHECLAEAIDGLVDRARNGLARLSSWDGTTSHLMAMIAATAISLLSFSATGA